MQKIIKEILDLKFLPIIDFDTMGSGTGLIETMLEQNVNILQVNFRNEEQLNNSSKIQEWATLFPEMQIGVGFLYGSKAAETAIDHGAKFVVSSILALDILKTAKQHDIPAIISGLTPSEIYQAHSTGCNLVQLFPASQLQKRSITALIEHMPNTKFILTGGLSLSMALDSIRLGVSAVGVKGSIFQKNLLIQENYKEIGISLNNFRERIQNL